MIITINRTIVKDDIETSLSEDERAEYAASKGDSTRTPITPPRQEFEAQASLVIKSESKTKTPRKKSSKELSTPITAKKLPPQKSTTIRRQPVRTICIRSTMRNAHRKNPEALQLALPL
ncbi:hypothetical protein N7G274_003797 [Stereocaulon virgatum]|uniref:Uncharacterized protein n=1 Tax=Stereocaulon virgatum TaxID=373712 RepID=A0ABR4ACK6_9LECA